MTCKYQKPETIQGGQNNGRARKQIAYAHPLNIFKIAQFIVSTTRSSQNKLLQFKADLKRDTDSLHNRL